MENTLVDVEKIGRLIRLLDELTSELIHEKAWDASKKAEQAKKMAQEWMFKDEQM